MKTTILLSALLLGAGMASAAVTVVSSFPLATNLSNSVGTQTIYTKGNATVSYASGSAVVTTTASAANGLESSYTEATQLQANWAVSFNIKFANSNDSVAKIFTSNYNPDNGVTISATNSADGHKFGLMTGTGAGNYSKTANVTTNLSQSSTAFQQLTLVCYNNKLYLYSGQTQGLFGTSKAEYLSNTTLGLTGNVMINQFHVGFGYNNDSYGIAANSPITMNNLKVYSFASTDSLTSVLQATGAAPMPTPEPATATLSLLGLAALMMRRKRA